MNFSEGKATFSVEAIDTFQKFVLSTSIKCQFPLRTMEVILKVGKEKLLSPVGFFLEFSSSTEGNSRRGGRTGLWEEKTEPKEKKGNWIEIGTETRMWKCSWKLSEDCLWVIFISL